MKPTFPKRLRSPLMSARLTVVLPTFCRVAATKIGRHIWQSSAHSLPPAEPLWELFCGQGRREWREREGE
eukprot:scaffold89530_cov35-Tisochrysis_lutea.AAC.1